MPTNLEKLRKINIDCMSGTEADFICRMLPRLLEVCDRYVLSEAKLQLMTMYPERYGNQIAEKFEIEVAEKRLEMILEGAHRWTNK